jgi:molybdopterin-guanine dinucleotide biosynthesis protein A
MASEQVTGYVLAGGRSSRMGQDKALLQLHGEPLIARAASKLHAVAERVGILGSLPEMAAHGELIRDLREGCGPLGGIEAGLLQMDTEWALILPVDMPFVPTRLLQWWVDRMTGDMLGRVSIFELDGSPQPALCLLHRDVAASIQRSLDRRELKLYPALEMAAVDSATAKDDLSGQRLIQWDVSSPEIEGVVSPAQWQKRQLWFANLNTPEEFTEADAHSDLLEE